jgi:16S rRNA (cytosine967-C5)-methyltransferase
VAAVAHDGQSLDALVAAESFQSAQERGLVRALCYDSIRWYLRLDAILTRLLSRPDQKLSPPLRGLAIVGLCQLLYTDIPAHAAVAETVNAARELGEPRAAGFLNAILRRMQREQQALCAAVDQDLATRTAHPAWLVQALTQDWPEHFAAILKANNAHPAFWLRVNCRHHTAAAYRERLERAGIAVKAAGVGLESLLLERAIDVRELPGFNEGWVSVQDGAAQLAAHLLAAQPGERVLDACAAPGGKTCHILEVQPELAELVAVDVSAQRLMRVQENLARLGLQATLVTGDAADPAPWWDGQPFDRILLDVPCSATGVIRRHPDIKLLRRPDDMVTLARRQGRLLTCAWEMLAPGGRLVYASCSALAAENSAVIGEFCRNERLARDVTADAASQLGLPGVTGKGYAIAAGTADMDGFYYACLEKP